MMSVKVKTGDAMVYSSISIDYVVLHKQIAAYS